MKIKSTLILGTALSLTACTVGGMNNAETCLLMKQRQATAAHAANSKRIADNLEQAMESAKQSLTRNRAYRNSQCIKVEQGALPPRPETLSEEAMMFQAVGAAVDILMRRMNSQEVTEAMLAVRRDNFLEVYEHWKRGHQESCALIVPSQSENWVCDNVFRIAGREAVFSCIQDLITRYTQLALNSCRAPLTQWEAEVSRIQNEPERLLSECQRSLETIADAEKRIPQLAMEAAINREETEKLAAQLSAMHPLPPGACRAMR